MTRQFTAIIEREDEGFVALCPELDVASQGDTIEAARANLQAALELFLEMASPEEIDQRFGKRGVRPLALRVEILNSGWGEGSDPLQAAIGLSGNASCSLARHSLVT